MSNGDANSCPNTASESATRHYRVKMCHSSETQICRCDDKQELNAGESVLLPTRYGKDLGLVLGEICNGCVSEDESIHTVIRKATEKDISTYENNQAREIEALEVCRERIQGRGLDMKLVSAHFLTEESKLLFFFTADERVDFRELVRDLVSVFKTRIELRQIGVRDESRVLGGLAVCGRPYCCHGVTDKLKPVSIRMAKEQNLSLNSMKISGPCGRLLCCLSYEYDFYKEEKSRLPSEGSRISLEGAFFRVQEVNILSRVVRLTAQDGRMRELPFCRLSKNAENGRWEVAEEAQ